MKGIVLSLYDYTGVAVKPWAEAGYECHCFDIQHPEEGRIEGNIHYYHADLHSYEVLIDLFMQYCNQPVVFMSAFPVCTDLAVSGAAHFAKKRVRDPLFQMKAVTYAKMCATLGDQLHVPYYIENPVSVLATKWRKPDHLFHPFEFGGYIPMTKAEHPLYPEHIAPRDAYSKKTCIWTNDLFHMPKRIPVECENFGASRQHLKLGGKSMRTKNIRSATPRGFAEAVWMANDPDNPFRAAVQEDSYESH